MVKIPKPITLNPHKHHYHFLSQKIKYWQTKKWSEVEEELLCLGENLLDFYIGNLTVEEICKECLFHLKYEKFYGIDYLLTWLETKEYRKITFSDSSEWVVKVGLDPERYIHIHPAKQSPFSIRVRATTLKTVVALNVLSVPIQKDMKQNLKKVNEIRKEFLHFSPIKTLQPKNGIFKLWVGFENKFQEYQKYII